MQYCYRVENADSTNVNPTELKEYILNLYRDPKFGKDAFTDEKDEDLPYITIYNNSENDVCIIITAKGRKSKNKDNNYTRIENIHNKLTDSDLQFQGLILNRPTLYEPDIQEWWDEKCNISGNRWTTLSHHGPYFAHISEGYQPLGADLIYNGRRYSLNPTEERVLGYYAKRLISEQGENITIELTKNPVFNRNYFSDLPAYLTPEHKRVFTDFSKFDFSNLERKIKQVSEENKNKTKLQKKRDKARKKEIELYYGYAKLDGRREKVGNYNIELPGIFMGRGENPKRGRIKPEVNPEEVTINIGINDPIPDAPGEHKWKEIVHDQTGTWIAKWRDPITGSVKYTRFSNEGKFKGECDLIKYEKARKLQSHINTVRDAYMRDAETGSTRKKQLATVLYLIDHFGLRVGGVKDTDDEADTIGASTIRVDHVKLRTGNIIILDFLGKDSIRFYKRLEVPPIIFQNFKSFSTGKKKDVDVFNLINADSINEYIKTFDKSFSAKVFRTRLASYIMYTELKKVHIPEGSTKAKIKTLFNKANAKVADVLNHARTVSKKKQASIEKLKVALQKLEIELKEKQRLGKSTVSLEKRISSKKDKINNDSETKNVAITTSLTNYIDPRIVVSWCAREGITPDNIYTKTLASRFNWAIQSTDKNWDYLTSPIIGNPELEPLTDEGRPTTVVEKKTKRKTERKTEKKTEKKKKKPVIPLEDSDDIPLSILMKRNLKKKKKKKIRPSILPVTTPSIDVISLRNFCNDVNNVNFQILPINIQTLLITASNFVIQNNTGFPHPVVQKAERIINTSKLV
jgi:DNA topoisomerase-1